jgi:hypothetical protein
LLRALMPAQQRTGSPWTISSSCLEAAAADAARHAAALYACSSSSSSRSQLLEQGLQLVLAQVSAVQIRSWPNVLYCAGTLACAGFSSNLCVEGTFSTGLASW